MGGFNRLNVSLVPWLMRGDPGDLNIMIGTFHIDKILCVALIGSIVLVGLRYCQGFLLEMMISYPRAMFLHMVSFLFCEMS